MAYKIKFRKRFIKGQLAVLNYVEREWGIKAAHDFQAKIDDALSVLKDHPYTGAPSIKYHGLRGIFITAHNRLFYRISGRTIYIVFLADTRKKAYET